VTQQVATQIDEVVATSRFVDHHCHGVTATPGGVLGFDQRLTEAREPMRFGRRFVDGPLGTALLAICPEVLGFDSRPSIEAYFERREQLGEREVARRFLAASQLSALIVDTGYAAEETSPADLGEMAGCPGYEVRRVESIAEAALADGPPGDRYVQTVRRGLADAAAEGVGFKSILAYRAGLDLPWSRPSEKAVTAACAGLTDGVPLQDPTLLRHLLYETLDAASERGLPIQFHVGYGDDDLDLRSANPLHLEGLIREANERDVPIVLLHCYPFHREAGFLASVFKNVFFDVGLAIPHVGLEADRILAEALEVSPFGKLLYSSDAARLPEFYFLASRLFRRAARIVFNRWVESGLLTEDDALRAIEMIGSENARLLYPGVEAE
jgi:uncharacterized protein